MHTQHTTETVTIKGEEFKTRHWYVDCAKELSGGERHRIYWGQFCTEAVKRVVSQHFNKAEWAAMAQAWNSGVDIYFNACTRLVKWDQCDVRQLVGRLKTETCYSDVPKGTFFWSPSDNVCITKEAARQLIEANAYPQ